MVHGSTVSVLIELAKETAGYGGRPVLHGIDLTIRTGERVAVLGRSGAGKTTLLNLLYGRLAERVALVPQGSALVKTLSVFHNVYMGRLDRHPTWYNLRTLVWPARRVVGEVAAVLDLVGLRDALFARAGELSGGQQQRASVARALYNGRPVLIGDEPVSALDRVQGAEILSRLTSRHETTIVALHDIFLALGHTDRIVVLDSGRIVLDAPSRTLTAADLIPYYGG
ncbi:MAG: ATP-binding cassette domain-containing protein [Alphaproteobacteria bacterium]|nr:MAG: ATP-binding cassette domain-containing protein [Alphaproteobacteria bacterium]TMJ45772.1 MAG: ATP-binding cassette domain-containing protein [Alphaproteobacteria bacterium]